MNNQIFNLLSDIKSLINNNTKMNWLDINQLTSYTSLSASTIRRAVKKGELKASRRTGKLLFRVIDIENWLKD